ncbi:MAG: transglutaminase-like domain-containing protein [Alphaproteobacteria bacterium]|nr:transglutaminase-like domain-containing protein [Alphaproteobacteria bacterium]
MSETRVARTDAETVLREVGEGPDSGFDLAEAALALASLDRPRVGLEHYRHHLDDLARDVADCAGGDDLDDCIGALNEIILERHGYEGDQLTYEDLQNANLMRVIDRRKGLPVALGILYIATARAQGWESAGLAFPGHFLVRVGHGGARAIVDPFNNGRVCGADDLRDLLKAMHGAEAELTPAHYAAVSDREILLRLQNNIKLRLVQLEEPEKAAAVAETMLLFAPDVNALWREAGLLHAHAGNLQAATHALEKFLENETRDGPRHQVATLLQQIRNKLN